MKDSWDLSLHIFLLETLRMEKLKGRTNSNTISKASNGLEHAHIEFELPIFSLERTYIEYKTLYDPSLDLTNHFSNTL